MGRKRKEVSEVAASPAQDLVAAADNQAVESAGSLVVRGIDPTDLITGEVVANIVDGEIVHPENTSGEESQENIATTDEQVNTSALDDAEREELEQLRIQVAALTQAKAKPEPALFVVDPDYKENISAQLREQAEINARIGGAIAPAAARPRY